MAYIVVVGTSSSGLTEVLNLVSGFKKETDAAYVIVLHLFETKVGRYLVSRLQERTSLACSLVTEDQPISPGHIYVALPGYHLIVSNGFLKVRTSAKENRW